MEEKSLECPRCGAPLKVTPETTAMVCAYCSSRLAIRTDSSGQRRAVVEATPTDTPPPAAGPAQEHLSQELQRVMAERQLLMASFERQSRLVQDQQREATRLRTLGWVMLGIALLPLLAAILSLPEYLPWVLLFGPASLFAFLLSAHTRREASRTAQTIETMVQPQLMQLDEQVSSLRTRLGELPARNAPAGGR
jgi:DNA-directed RNA polymerase subunit RPC12/RpoP